MAEQRIVFKIEGEADPRELKELEDQLEHLQPMIRDALKEAEPAAKEAGKAIDALGDRFDGLVGRAEGAKTKVMGSLSSIGSKAASLAVPIAAGAAIGGAALVGLGAGALKLGGDFDSAYDTIAAQTGATGEQLARLQSEFKDVVGNAPVDFETAGAAVAVLGQRLDIVGDVSALGTQLSNLSRVTGVDVTQAGDQAIDMFARWQTSAADQGNALDLIFQKSQESGLGYDVLSAAVTDNATQLQAAGLDLAQGIQLVADLGTAGIDTAAVMPGITKSLGQMAKDGVAPAEGLKRIFDTVQAEGPNSATAMEVFGKSGLQVAAAIATGALSLSDLEAGLGPVQGGINDTAASTDDWGQKLDLLKNKAQLALEPVGSMAMDAAGAVADGLLNLATPAIEDAGAALSAFQEGFDLEPDMSFLDRLENGLGNASAAMAETNPAISAVLDTILSLEQGARPLIDALRDFGSTVLVELRDAWDELQPSVEKLGDYWENTLQPAVEKIVPIVLDLAEGALGSLFDGIKTVLPPVIDFAVTLGEHLMPIVTRVFEFIQDHKQLFITLGAIIAVLAGGPVTVLIGVLILLGQHADTIKQAISNFATSVGDSVAEIQDKVRGFVRDLKQRWDDLVRDVRELPDTFRRIGRDIIDGLKEGARQAWQTFLGWFNGILALLPATVKKILGISSPSRVFLEIGRWIMEGLQLGIEFGGQLAFEAMEEAIERLGIARVEAERLRQELMELTGGQSAEVAVAAIRAEMEAAQEAWDAYAEAMEADMRGNTPGKNDTIEMEARFEAAREAHDAQMEMLGEEIAAIEQAGEAWEGAAQAAAEAYAAAEQAVQAAEDAALERAEQVHDQVLGMIAEERRARTAAYEAARGQLEQRRDALTDELDLQRRNIDAMKLALDTLKFDLGIDAEMVKLDALTSELERVRSIADSFSVLESDPRAERENQIAEMRAKVRVETQEQRDLLRQALDEGLVSPEDQRTVELLLLGYKARASDVERIMAEIEASYGGQVDAQRAVIDAKQAEIAAAERALAVAEQTAAVEEARVQTILDGLDREIAALEAAHTAAMEALDDRVAGENRRHAEAIANTEAEFAHRLALLGHTEEEIQAMVDRARQVAAEIAEEARALYGGAVNGVRDAGLGAAAAVEAAFVAVGTGMTRVVNDVRRAVVELGRDVSDMEERIERTQGISGGVSVERHERAPMHPSMRQNMFAGKRGSGGWRAGSDDSWRRWHFGEEPNDPGRNLAGGALTPGDETMQPIQVSIQPFPLSIKIEEHRTEQTLIDNRVISEIVRIVSRELSKQATIQPVHP